MSEDEPAIINRTPLTGQESKAQPDRDAPEVIVAVPKRVPKGIVGIVSKEGKIVERKTEKPAPPQIISEAPKTYPKPDLRVVNEIIDEVPGITPETKPDK